MIAQTSGASDAPSVETSRRARIEASGVSSSLAASLAAIVFPMSRRDDLATLAAVTASRCSSSVGSIIHG